jgi:hypothetical protein
VNRTQSVPLLTYPAIAEATMLQAVRHQIDAGNPGTGSD